MSQSTPRRSKSPIIAPVSGAAETGAGPDAPIETASGHRTARLAAAILCASDACFTVPTKREREAILFAFVRTGYVIYGNAFDIVRRPVGLDLSEADEVQRRLDEVIIYEIKSTNSKKVKPDLRGYFFSMSTAELLVAQNLGPRYRFAFVNTLTRTHMELTLRDVFARARGIYPAWSIQF